MVLSPGPGRPEQAGICIESGKEAGRRNSCSPGVCLGHQAICRAYGGAVTYARELMHGKTSQVQVDPGALLFQGLGPEITVGRYHSLAVDPETMPDCLAVTARTADGEIMAVEHKKYPVYGVQFHPESILTPQGRRMVENLLEGLRR